MKNYFEIVRRVSPHPSHRQSGAEATAVQTLSRPLMVAFERGTLGLRSLQRRFSSAGNAGLVQGFTAQKFVLENFFPKTCREDKAITQFLLPDFFA